MGAGENIYFLLPYICKDFTSLSLLEKKKTLPARNVFPETTPSGNKDYIVIIFRED